jgi:hexosaminidase
MKHVDIRILALPALLCLLINSGVQAQSTHIIPQPQKVLWGEDNFILDKQVKIAYFLSYPEIAGILQSSIEQAVGLQLGIIESQESGFKGIGFKDDPRLATEAYELHISSAGIQIAASSHAGLFYGVQSLGQLLSAHSQSGEHVAALHIPGISIKDSPRFSWRAFMLDEARFFQGMDQVKMLMDEMAFLKMNVFHWHLVDDQGWRIEIKKYPLLTEIGSKRKSTQVGPLKWDSPIQSAEVHEGYYTQEQIRELVAYASERHITVVPEIEMPGHSSAAIASYSWLGTAKKEIEVPIKFGVGKDVYDVSDPKVYQFLTDVLDEVIDLFPSKVIHIGGDEVKYEHWKSSESVQAYMKEHGLETPADLQIFFTNSISQYLQNKGRRMMGWNEIMGHNLHEYQAEEETRSNQKLAQETVVHFWKGDVALATLAASNGYEIVNSLHSETYLDYSYSSIPMARAYAFDPVPAELDPKYHDKVIGMGCQMWGEWIPTHGHMHFQTFPRIAAYAEVGWTEKENKNYENFESALQNLKNRWEQKGIYYAPDSALEPETE